MSVRVWGKENCDWGGAGRGRGVCGGAGEGGGGVCDRAVEAQDSSKKVSMGCGGSEKCAWGWRSVCVCGVCGGSACV